MIVDKLTLGNYIFAPEDKKHHECKRLKWFVLAGLISYDYK